jgi:hypothetical protein
MEAPLPTTDVLVAIDHETLHELLNVTVALVDAYVKNTTATLELIDRIDARRLADSKVHP